MSVPRRERMQGLLHALEAEMEAAAQRPGGRLPAERHLAAALGATRAEVRRLLQDLENRGRITRHVGRGTFVAESTRGGEPLAADFPPAALMTTSLLFEPEVAALAAMSATQADFQRLQACLAKAASLQESWEEYEYWDVSLHRGLAVATHNPEIVAMVDVLNSVRDTPLWAQLKREGATSEARSRVQEEHAAIVEAVIARDRDAAASAMAHHLRSVRRLVLRSSE